MTRLGDVAGVRGVVLDHHDEDTLPYIALEHVANGGKLVGLGSATDFISAKTPFRNGDTLYGKLRPNLRKTLRATFDGVCSTEILAIYSQNGVEGRFLSEILRSDELHWHAMQGITGTKMPRTSWGHIRSYRFALPPLAEQRAIAEALDSIDAAIERTDDVIASTERLRDSLLHELLTRGVPGWHTSWREEPGIGRVPASWEVVRLGDVAEFQQGGTPPKERGEYWDGDIPFVTGADLRGLRVGRSNARSFLTEEGLHCGSTVVCGAGSLLLATRTRVGLVGVASEVMGASQDITLIQPGEDVDKAYLYRFLVMMESQLQRMSRGTTIQGITRDDVANLGLPLPQLTEQQAIAGMLDAVDVAVERAREERASLQGLKASASDALLTGKIRVGGR